MMLLFSSYSTRHVLNGFTVFRSVGDDSLYSLYDFVEQSGNETITYYDPYPNVHIQTSYSYQVRSAWINHWVIPEDTLFSLPGYAKINGDDNFVTVLVTTNPENIENEIPLSVYPNPFSTSTTIEYKLDHPGTVRIIFFNQSGKQVDVIEKYKQNGLTKFIWTPGNLPDGTYYFRLQEGGKVAFGSMILMRF